MTFDPLLSTNENLKLNGFSTKPTNIAGKKEIVDSKGMTVHRAVTAYEVNDWLKKRAGEAVTHDGGPDRIDGAPSDGDIL